MRTRLTSICAVLLGIVLLTSCTKDNVSDYNTLSTDCPDTISFAAKVQPLVQQNCATSGCHDASASAGYEFSTHAQISANASIMLSTMRWEQGVAAMPQGASQLADSLIQQFSCWIQQGKLNN